MKNLALIFFIFITSFLVSAQTQDSLINFPLDCGGKKSIRIPSHYLQSDVKEYTEGHIFSLVFRDGSSMTILCGGNMTIGLPKNQKKALYYKKTVINGHQVIYQDVPKDKLKLFKKSLKLLKKDLHD